MGTVVRADISKKNAYWIDKHRYYELKHFCLQYPFWVKSYAELSFSQSQGIIFSEKKSGKSDPTLKIAEQRLFYAQRMEMVSKSAKKTDKTLVDYIFKAVTEGYSYTYLKAKLDIPCCRDVYYELYRKFFWLLDKERQ